MPLNDTHYTGPTNAARACAGQGPGGTVDGPFAPTLYQTPKSPMPGHRGLFSRLGSRPNRDSRFSESRFPAKSGHYPEPHWQILVLVKRKFAQCRNPTQAANPSRTMRRDPPAPAPARRRNGPAGRGELTSPARGLAALRATHTERRSALRLHPQCPILRISKHSNCPMQNGLISHRQAHGAEYLTTMSEDTAASLMKQRPHASSS